MNRHSDTQRRVCAEDTFRFSGKQMASQSRDTFLSLGNLTGAGDEIRTHDPNLGKVVSSGHV